VNRKKIQLIVFWIFTVIFFECIYKMTIFKNIIDGDFIQMLFFCIPSSLLIYLFTTLFSEKLNRRISTIILLLMFFIFFAQMVYFKVYNGVFSIYSMTNGGQVLEFWRTIISTIFGSLYNFLCLFVPLIIYFLLKNREFDFSKNSLYSKCIGVLAFIFAICVGFYYINKDKKAIYSSYNLFFNTHAPILSAKKFGLLTTMGLDLNRIIFGLADKKVEIIIDNTEPDSSVTKEFYNILDINFDDLISNEDDETIASMHKYFESLKGTKKNEYTGLFKGKNVVFFLAESLDPIAISEELTPTLYKLASSGFDFKNYYAPLYPASTADGEFRTEWSLISSRGDTLTLYAEKDVYSPYLFINSFSGYNQYIFHNYNGDYYNRKKYFDALGYKNFKACEYGLNLPCNSFHESDYDMVDITTEDFINSTNPFFAYYITLSGHMSYIKANNKIVQKNWDLVKDLPYSDRIKGYIASNIELDKAVELLIKRLEEANKLDDTVIIITPDHYPYGLSNDQINEVSTINRDDDFELYKSDLIIWNNKMDKKVIVNKVGSNPDVLPTMLNLFGIEYDSRFIMGQDLLSDSEGLVVFANRSFITDTVKYDSVTDEIIVKDGSPINTKYINKINNLVDNQFKISNLILENNYYEKVFKGKID